MVSSSGMTDIDVLTSDMDADFDGSFDGQSGDRRSHKQEMEKKRRARINDSLSRLKSLVLQALKKDEARYSKLEKADILEMTVKYLQSVRHHDAYAVRSQEAEGHMRYISGFNQCAQHVVSFLDKCDVLPADTRIRLNSYLAGCMQALHRAAGPISGLNASALPSPPTIHPALRSVSLEQHPPTLTPPRSPEELVASTQVFPGHRIHKPTAVPVEPMFPRPSTSPHLSPEDFSQIPAHAKLCQLPVDTRNGLGPVRSSVLNKCVWRPF